MQFSSWTIPLEQLEDRLLFSVSWGAIPHLIGQDLATQDFPNITGAGQSIAIIDTGVDYNHPGLGGGWGNTVIAGYDFVSNQPDPMDTFGHGTQIAGVIAADPFVFNGAQYAGIAPGAKIIALRVEDSSGVVPPSRVKAALQWVIDHRVQYNITAVNLSIGTGNYTKKITRPAYGPQLAALTKTGVFIAAASGNEGVRSPAGIDYPAADRSVISVGSVDPNGAVSSFTSRGKILQLLAPGNNVPSTLYDSINGTQIWAYSTGTSFSSPYAAGAAMLVKQADPALSPFQIASVLRSTGRMVRDPATGLRFPLINVDAAIRSALQIKRRAQARKAAKARASLSGLASHKVAAFSLAGPAIAPTASPVFNTSKPVGHSNTSPSTALDSGDNQLLRNRLLLA